MAHAIIVTASVRKFGFGTLDSYFRLSLWTPDIRLRTWNFGLRLVNLPSTIERGPRRYIKIYSRFMFLTEFKDFQSQNKISGGAFVIECHGFAIFCLKPLKTI